MISREYSALAVIVVTGLMCSGGCKQKKTKQNNRQSAVQPAEWTAAHCCHCHWFLSLSAIETVTVRHVVSVIVVKAKKLHVSLQDAFCQLSSHQYWTTRSHAHRGYTSRVRPFQESC